MGVRYSAKFDATASLRRGLVFCGRIFLILACTAAFAAAQQPASPQAPRMTGRYHFLGPEDTLSILQEGNILKGYIDVYTAPNESDAILSYPLVIGSRNGNKVQFKTGTIHEVFYRFSGTVGRGAGRKPSDPDYLQLTGNLEMIEKNSVTETQKVQKQAVVFKSIPRGEGPPE